MLNHKGKKQSAQPILDNVKKEMAVPRMAKSARITVRNLDRAQVPEPPTTLMSGIVDMIIPADGSSQPEKVEIAIQEADDGYRRLRIENSLTDQNGEEVMLKKGAHVEVTVKEKT